MKKTIFIHIIGLMIMMINSAFSQHYIIEDIHLFKSSAYCKSLEFSIDSIGNLYFSGEYKGDLEISNLPDSLNIEASTMNDIFITKKNAQNNILWINKITGSGNSYLASQLLDNEGNYFVGGIFNKELQIDSTKIQAKDYYDLFLAKYDGYGKLIWLNNYGGKGMEILNTIALGKNKDILIGGMFNKGFNLNTGKNKLPVKAGSGTDGFISRLDREGQVIWFNQLTCKKNIVVLKILTDTNDYIYVAGSFEGQMSFKEDTSVLISNGESDIFLLKYEPAGELLWAKNFGGKRDENISGAILTENQHVVISGEFKDQMVFEKDMFLNSVGNQDIFLAEMDDNGNTLWINQCGGIQNDFSSKLTKGNDDNIYFSGLLQNISALNNPSDIKSQDIIESKNRGGEIVIAKVNDYGILSPIVNFGGNILNYCSSFIIKENGDILVGGDFIGNLIFNDDTISRVNNRTAFIIKLKDACKDFKIDIGSDITLCQGDSVLLDAGGVYKYYEWNEGLSFEKTLYVSKSGIYFLEVTDEYGCFASDSIIIDVNELPEAKIYANTAYLGEPTHFNDISESKSSQIIKWNWNFGDNFGHDTIQNPEYYYLAPGEYIVTLTVFDEEGCSDTDSLKVKVIDIDNAQPSDYFLGDNFPDPFTEYTLIRYGLPEKGKVILNIYNIKGQPVKELVNCYRDQGIYEVKINSTNWNQGMYYYKIEIQGETCDFSEVKRMIKMK